MIAPPNRIVLLGSTGRLGTEIQRRLGSSATVLGVSRGRSGGSPEARADVHDGAALAKLLRPGDLVIDASAAFRPRGGRTLAGLRLALAAGAHWLDLSQERAGVVGSTGLDADAKSKGLALISGAGLFPGLCAPFVREACQAVKRVNEILIGWAPGQGLAFGPESELDLACQAGGEAKLLLGGEWSSRRLFGDRRAFFHPEPLGELFSYNLDVPDLELYTGPGFKSASVRVSIGARPWRLRMALRALEGARPGIEPQAALKKLRLWSGRPALRSGCLTLLVRGVDIAANPQERRRSWLFPDAGVGLAATPAVLLARRALEGKLDPGAGPCLAALSVEELTRELESLGYRQRLGSLGGWQS
jgi:hypothetical protein